MRTRTGYASGEVSTYSGVEAEVDAHIGHDFAPIEFGTPLHLEVTEDGQPIVLASIEAYSWKASARC